VGRHTCLIVEDELACMNGKTGVAPAQQGVHERFREALGSVQTTQQQLPEALFDVSEEVSRGLR
jgi:hypothetical protein